VVRGRQCHILSFVVGKCFWHFARPAIFDSQLLDQNRDCCLGLYPTCIRRPRYGGGCSCRNIATPFGMEKLEWLGYPTVKKIRRFVLTELTNVTDGQTDRRTPHDGYSRAYA